MNAKEDGSVSLYKGPGKKYGTVSGGCNIANGEKLHIDTEVDTGKDGVWGKTEAGEVSGWVDIAQATNTEEKAVELIPDTEEGNAETGNTSLQIEKGEKEEETEAVGLNSASAPEKTSTPTPEPEKTSTPTPEPEKTSTPTPEPEKTSTPAPEPEKTSTPTPEPEKTSTPTPEPEKTSTPTPEPEKTSTPTLEPTKTAAPEKSDAPAENAGKEASSESVESSTSNGMSSAIWILVIVILIGIAVVIWLIKRKSKKSE